jgi:NAD(P)-dependent dehydrogenase (short-subunit alcohol dehydrogenase family)
VRKDAQRYHTFERFDRDQLPEAVILVGARNPDRRQAAAAALRTDCLDARYFELDVVRPATIDAAAAMVAAEFQRVDVLVNNAGINAPRRWSAGHGRPENDDFRTPKTTAPISPCPSGASIRPSVMIGYA